MSETIISTLILGVSGLLITAYYNHSNKRLANDKMTKELFKEFNERYDELNDKLDAISQNFKSLQELEENPELKHKLTDYFNLCAEEYFWYKKGRIDKEIWNAWNDGMNDWYNLSIVFKDAWDEEIEKNGCKSYYIKSKNDFFKYRSNKNGALV